MRSSTSSSHAIAKGLAHPFGGRAGSIGGVISKGRGQSSWRESLTAWGRGGAYCSGGVVCCLGGPVLEESDSKGGRGLTRRGRGFNSGVVGCMGGANLERA